MVVTEGSATVLVAIVVTVSLVNAATVFSLLVVDSLVVDDVEPLESLPAEAEVPPAPPDALADFLASAAALAGLVFGVLV